MPTAPPLSRILSPFLGGTRKGPPEGFPAESPDRASVRAPRRRHPAESFERVFDKTKPADVLQAVHTSAIWCLFEQLMPIVFSFYLYFLPILCYNAYDKNT